MIGRLLLLCSLLFSLLLSSALPASESACFTTHIRDAIKLNRERRSSYKEWGGVGAAMLSRNLVLMEKLLLIKARSFDRRGLKWQRMGIPFLCRDLVDMSLTPAMPSRPHSPPVVEQAAPVKTKKEVVTYARVLTKQHAWPQLHHHLEVEVNRLKAWPFANCLQRHFYESVQRTAWLMPQYLPMIAGEKDRQEFQALVEEYIRLHFTGMAWGRFLDTQAVNLQLNGIALFCQDVPPIDTRPQFP